MEICSVCGKRCAGGFEVYDRVESGVPVIVIDGTPDCNFNVCDWCNKTVCFDCSDDRDSGLCNECLARSRGAGDN
jgi:hypothetical protein